MSLVVFVPYFTVTVKRSDGTFCPRYLPVLQVISVPNERLKRRKEEYEHRLSRETRKAIQSLNGWKKFMNSVKRSD